MPRSLRAAFALLVIAGTCVWLEKTSRVLSPAASDQEARQSGDAQDTTDLQRYPASMIREPGPVRPIDVRFGPPPIPAWTRPTAAARPPVADSDNPLPDACVKDSGCHDPLPVDGTRAIEAQHNTNSPPDAVGQQQDAEQQDAEHADHENAEHEVNLEPLASSLAHPIVHQQMTSDIGGLDPTATSRDLPPQAAQQGDLPVDATAQPPINSRDLPSYPTTNTPHGPRAVGQPSWQVLAGAAPVAAPAAVAPSEGLPTEAGLRQPVGNRQDELGPDELPGSPKIEDARETPIARPADPLPVIDRATQWQPPAQPVAPPAPAIASPTPEAPVPTAPMPEAPMPEAPMPEAPTQGYPQTGFNPIKTYPPAPEPLFSRSSRTQRTRQTQRTRETHRPDSSTTQTDDRTELQGPPSTVEPEHPLARPSESIEAEEDEMPSPPESTGWPAAGPPDLAAPELNPNAAEAEAMQPRSLEDVQPVPERPAPEQQQAVETEDDSVDRTPGGTAWLDLQSDELRDAATGESAEKPGRDLPPQLERRSSVDQQDQRRQQAMQIVSGNVEGIVRHGFSLASRNAIFSARAEFIAALRMVAEALDAMQGGQEHSAHLDAGLTALREAEDLISGYSDVGVDVARIVKTHQTPVLQNHPGNISPLLARQKYYTFAQQELAAACGNTPAAARALYGLGKLHTSRAVKGQDTVLASAPKAVVLHRAAMMVDANNYQAANELGVLLARYGELQQARQVLLHGLSARPTPSLWYNLAKVHRQLGEKELCTRAEYEFQIASRAAGSPSDEADPDAPIRWVDPAAFARLAPGPRVQGQAADQARASGPREKPATGRGRFGWLPWK